MTTFWQDLLEELEAGHRTVLLYVLHSEGSSPGRQGFKMVVSGSGRLIGSIGGGIMEHKLVEWCRQDLLQRAFEPFCKRQVHQADIGQDRSGMICSGEQTVAFYGLTADDRAFVRSVSDAMTTREYGILTYDPKGLQFIRGEQLPERFFGQVIGPEQWMIMEDIGHVPHLHIIGGGHVGLALSKIASQVGFRVLLYDDREGLNTLEQNHYAECIHVADYAEIRDYLPSGGQHYLVLMSFGYRTDKLVLRQLLNHPCRYLGMMGSQAKVDQLMEELAAEGISPELLERVHAPIGMPIASKTPEEIAVSVLAELIWLKNRI